MAEHIVLSAPLFVAAFWSLWLGLDYRTHPSAPRQSLLCFMITTAGLYLCHFIYFSLSGHAPWPVDLLYRYCNLAVFPLWHFYLCKLTLHRLSRRAQFLWLMPAVLLAPAQLMWSEAQVVARIVFAGQVISVFILGWRMLRSYETAIASSYADTEPYSLRPLRGLLLFLFLTTLASFTANLLGRERFLSSVAMLAVPSTLFSAFIFMLGYESVRLLPKVTAVKDEVDEVGTCLSADSDHGERGENLLSGEGDDQRDHFAQLQRDVLRAMDEEKLYLQPNIKISDLALHLGSNRNYIWRAVNVGLGISFSELVNRRRIDHFILLVKQNELRDMDDTWQKCGFTSASAFYRNFKLYKGCSPAEYFSRAT
ncbi:MAG: helix-turn-helix domain-containing protein [Bacteroidaceae bacterium]|nr:helix-turn-helix domain-containing protein [Bacteroidaceae bacterium]